MALLWGQLPPLMPGEMCQKRRNFPVTLGGATQRVRYEGAPHERYYQLNAVLGNRGGHVLPDLELP